MKPYIYRFCKRFFSLSGLLALLGLMAGSQNLEPTLAQATQTTVFVNVNVIPMDTERVLENQTVIVEGDQITTIGPAAEIEVPDGAEIVEGNGAYLMPGLADMHMHLAFDPDPDSLHLYLAQGVTTVRNFNAIPQHFEWRDQVAQGALLGPTILTSGNGIFGVPPFLNSSVLMFRAMVILAPLVIGLLIWLVVWLLAKFTGLIPNFDQIRGFILPSFGRFVGGRSNISLVKSYPLDCLYSTQLPPGLRAGNRG